MTLFRIALVVLLFGAFGTAKAEVLSLDDFLVQVQDSHPLFKKEAASANIAIARRDALEGTKDWMLRGKAGYAHTELPQTDFGDPKKAGQAQFEVEAQKLFWQTGGTASLRYRHSYNDRDFTALELPPELASSFSPGIDQFYQGGILASYTQPLLKNRTGMLNRVEHGLADIDVSVAEMLALENQEAFLLTLSELFIEWVASIERVTIVKERVGIAEQQLARIRRKHKANVVDKVDVLRTRDDVWIAKQSLSELRAQLSGIRARISKLSGLEDIASMSPKLNLYSRKPFPAQEATEEELTGKARLLKIVRLRQEQIEIQRKANDENTKHRLDLTAFAGINKTDENFGSSFGGEEPEAGLFLGYSYPLGNTAAHNLASALIQQNGQLENAFEDTKLGLQSTAASLLATMKKLEETLILNEKQIASAKERTTEELRIYNQGRGELNFVLQGQDGEQNARLRYTETAAQYQLLYLRFQEVLDSLLPSDII